MTTGARAAHGRPLCGTRPTVGQSRALALAFLALAIAVPARGQAPGARKSVRITMDALHQAGGVPPGWQLSPGEGVVGRGRAAFVDLGCHNCHAVRGAAMPTVSDEPGRAGPDLTVGPHGHAAFAEPPLYRAGSLSAAVAPRPPDCGGSCQGCHDESFASCDARFHRFAHR